MKNYWILRKTTPDRHWAVPGEFFYVGYTTLGGKHETMPFLESHWLETYPYNKFDNFYEARDFAEMVGFMPYIKIYKRMETGESVEQAIRPPWESPGWRHDPKYRYIIQGLQLTNGYGILRKNPFWQMMGSGNDLKQMIHLLKCYRESVSGCGGSICRIMDTKEERVMEEYNDTPENDERRRQKAIQESPINQRRHEEFLARKKADPEGYWKR